MSDRRFRSTIFAARRDDMDRLSEFIECANCGHKMRFPNLEGKGIPERCPKCGKTGADLPPEQVDLEVFA